jgi:hypothetical protein
LKFLNAEFPPAVFPSWAAIAGDFCVYYDQRRKVFWWLREAVNEFLEKTKSAIVRGEVDIYKTTPK